MPDRILVYGVTGTGKTTLAARISELTGLPWHSVDDLTWERDWVPVATDEQRRRIAEVCAGERWILDTAYGKWRDVVLPRVELIVALDYARWVSLGRLLRRTFARIIDRRPVCNGNVETLRTTLGHDSIIAWHFKSFARKRARIREWAADPARTVVRLTSPKQTRRWLATLAQPVSSGSDPVSDPSPRGRCDARPVE
jgi:adenylate kinase family enzyme